MYLSYGGSFVEKMGEKEEEIMHAIYIFISAIRVPAIITLD